MAKRGTLSTLSGLAAHSSFPRGSFSSSSSLLPLRMQALMADVSMAFRASSLAGASCIKVRGVAPRASARPAKFHVSAATGSRKREVSTIADSVLPDLSKEQVAARAKGAVLGALVADAASMGLHWNYDQAGIIRMINKQSNGPFDMIMGFLASKQSVDLDEIKAEFFEPPTNPFYKYDSGEQSPYGDEAVTLVASLAKEGSLVPEKFSEDSYAYFKAYKGRLNSLMKRYLEVYEAGGRWPTCGVKGDSQAHSLVRVPAVVARYYGTPEMEQMVIDAVRVHQDDQTAIDYAVAYAFILERVILGATVPEALKWAAFEKKPPLYDDIRALIQDALGEMGKDPRDVTMKYGISCSLPGPFAGPLATCFSNSKSFERAVRANIVGGGDSCSRAAVIGGLMGAAVSVDGIPDSFKAKTNKYKQWEEAADKIISANA